MNLPVSRSNKSGLSTILRFQILLDCQRIGVYVSLWAVTVVRCYNGENWVAQPQLIFGVIFCAKVDYLQLIIHMLVP